MLVLLLFFFTLAPIQSENILAVFPLNAKSHYTMYETLLLRLAELGHNVDVVTHFVAKKVPPSYNQLSIAGTLPDLNNNLSMKVVDTLTTMYDLVNFMVNANGVQICEIAFNTDVMKNLRKSKKKYNLIITEIFGSDCMLGFGYIFKAPIITMTSSVALPWANDRIGNPDNPSYIPTYFMSSTSKMSLYERICNTLYLVSTKIWYYQLSTKASDELSRKFFGPAVPPLADLVQNISLIFVNSHYSFSFARPTVPNFIEVAGIHIKEPKLLSNHFQGVLKTEKEGVIYLSMGSMVLTETFDFDKLQGMFDTFGQLPYKILWKAKRENFSKKLTIPGNIHFEHWIPQIEVLCDSRIKLFVAHGGLLGVQEAMYCGVPLLGIPLFADQIHNIHAAEKLGFGVKIDYKNINNKTFFNAVTKLLHPSYKKNAEMISRQFKDRPMSALDTAVFWTEYVLRHDGAPHLRSVGADLPWYQYYLVDIFTILVTILVTFVYLGYKIMKFGLSWIFENSKLKSA